MDQQLLKSLSQSELSRLRTGIANTSISDLDEKRLESLYSNFTDKKYHPLWNPLAGPQTMAYESLADEVFFGGAAGPGKSDCILGLALTQHKRSLILRREASYLEGLTTRIKELVGPKGWKSIGIYGGIVNYEGRVIQFSGCEHERDKINFQGIQRDFYGFDEISHFSKSQFKFIIGWNRSVDPKQRCRVFCAGNPPTTPEGRWVVEEWAPWLDKNFGDPALPGELRWYTNVDGKMVWKKTGEAFHHKGERIVPISRTFIPALLKDNPFYYGTTYHQKLQAMDEPMRSQMLYGDMSIGMDDNAWQVIPTDWIRKAQARWTENPPPQYGLTGIGVDIARKGDDSTAITRRFGPWFAKPIKIPGVETFDGGTAAARVQDVMEGGCYVNIDVTGGFGGSPYDILKSLHGEIIHGINNSEATEWKNKAGIGFTNVRAASYWMLREALDPSGNEELALPPDPKLVADLTAPRYKLLARGIQLEPKEDIAKRIGRSPDLGDSLILSFWREKKKELWIR